MGAKTAQQHICGHIAGSLTRQGNRCTCSPRADDLQHAEQQDATRNKLWETCTQAAFHPLLPSALSRLNLMPLNPSETRTAHPASQPPPYAVSALRTLQVAPMIPLVAPRRSTGEQTRQPIGSAGRPTTRAFQQNARVVNSEVERCLEASGASTV